MSATLLVAAALVVSGAGATGVWRDPEAHPAFDAAPAQFTLFKLAPDNAFGAVALDGSPAAFYWHEGSSDNWAFYWEGGELPGGA